MGSRRILLVDDEDDIREVAALALRTIGGHEVLTAASGEEALARAIEGQPDVILLDVMMPGLDGPTTLSRLQQDPRTHDIDVVFLTAKTQVSERSLLTNLPGVAGLIAKPFDPMALADQVADIVRWPQR